MLEQKPIQISIVRSDDHYERYDHVFRFSVEEKYSLLRPSPWYTSKNTQDEDDDEDEDEEEEVEIIRKETQRSVKKVIGFSNDDILSGCYQKSVLDWLSMVGFFSDFDVEVIKGDIFRWVEKEMMQTTDVFNFTVIDVKINVLIIQELPGHEFVQGEEMAPATAPVEVHQGTLIENEDDEVEEEEEYDQLRDLMAEYMVEEPNDEWFMEDDDGEEGIEEEDYWFEFSKANGVSRDMIEASIKTRDYDSKRDEGECRICMDGFSSKQEEKVVEMPCSHVFHKLCIVEWLELKNSCPLCRFEICNKDDSH